MNQIAKRTLTALALAGALCGTAVAASSVTPAAAQRLTQGRRGLTAAGA